MLNKKLDCHRENQVHEETTAWHRGERTHRHLQKDSRDDYIPFKSLSLNRCILMYARLQILCRMQWHTLERWTPGPRKHPPPSSATSRTALTTSVG